MSVPSYVFNEDNCDLPQIDAEIARLTVRIQHLKTVRNSHIPCSRLSPDLLLEIMLVHKYDHEVGDLDKFTDPPLGCFLPRSYRWISISHVCRHWRTVALNSSLLWTSIHVPCASPEWVDELLRRSHPAPISVLNLHDFGSSTAIVRSIAPFSSRHGMGRPIHRLHLFYPHGDLSCIAPLELNHLKELTVDGRERMGERDLEHLKPFIARFAASTSQLSSLVLRHSLWDKRLLQGTLTRLSLLGTKTRNLMGWDEFLSALAAMKLLRHLTLNGILFELQPSLTNESILVTLPQLESLSLLNDETETQAKFLRSVSVPPAATADFESYALSIPSFIAAIPSFSQVLAATHPHQFLVLRVACGRGRTSMYMLMDYINRDEYSTDGPYQRMLECHARGSGVASSDSFMQGISTLLKLPPLSHIQHLRLESGCAELSPLLINTLAALPELSTLCIDELPGSPWLTRTLLSALPTCHGGESSDVSTSTTLPGSWLCQACKSFSETWFPNLHQIKYLRGLDPDDPRLQSVKKILSFVHRREGKSNDWKLSLAAPEASRGERIEAFVR